MLIVLSNIHVFWNMLLVLFLMEEDDLFILHNQDRSDLLVTQLTMIREDMVLIANYYTNELESNLWKKNVICLLFPITSTYFVFHRQLQWRHQEPAQKFGNRAEGVVGTCLIQTRMDRMSFLSSVTWHLIPSLQPCIITRRRGAKSKDMKTLNLMWQKYSPDRQFIWICIARNAICFRHLLYWIEYSTFTVANQSISCMNNHKQIRLNTFIHDDNVFSSTHILSISRLLVTRF